MNISSVIITFNPDISNLTNNINTFCKDVNFVILVDNSTEIQIKNEIKNLAVKSDYIYLDMFGNSGIANALNQGIKIAKKLNSVWVLTMDQDSYFLSGISEYKDYLKINNTDNTLLLYPAYSISNNIELFLGEKFVMQSGNLLNIDIYNKIGIYRDDYFIDFVDYEYCLRGNRFGYKIKNISNVLLQHNTGEKKIFNLLGLNLTYFVSNPIRYYYVTRNGLDTALRYKNFKILSITLKLFFRVLLIENSKKLKIIYISKGFIHFCFSKFGPLLKNHKI